MRAGSENLFDSWLAGVEWPVGPARALELALVVAAGRVSLLLPADVGFTELLDVESTEGVDGDDVLLPYIVSGKTAVGKLKACTSVGTWTVSLSVPVTGM